MSLSLDHHIKCSSYDLIARVICEVETEPDDAINSIDLVSSGVDVNE